MRSRNLKRGFTGAASGPARIPEIASRDYTLPWIAPILARKNDRE
jgi:hypothetical protein